MATCRRIQNGDSRWLQRPCRLSSTSLRRQSRGLDLTLQPGRKTQHGVKAAKMAGTEPQEGPAKTRSRHQARSRPPRPSRYHPSEQRSRPSAPGAGLFACPTHGRRDQKHRADFCQGLGLIAAAGAAMASQALPFAAGIQQKQQPCWLMTARGEMAAKQASPIDAERPGPAQQEETAMPRQPPGWADASY